MNNNVFKEFWAQKVWNNALPNSHHSYTFYKQFGRNLHLILDNLEQMINAFILATIRLNLS